MPMESEPVVAEIHFSQDSINSKREINTRYIFIFLTLHKIKQLSVFTCRLYYRFSSEVNADKFVM